MAVATSTALLLAAAGSGGLQLWGAKKSADASKKAAEQQTASADQGLALQKDIYGQQVAGMQPYAQFGQQALGSLGSLMGFPALPPPTGRDATGAPLGPITGQQGPMNLSDPRVQRLAAGGSMADPGMSDGTLGGAMGQSSYQTPGQGTGPTAPGGSVQAPGGQMVTLIAPTGEQGKFPADQAEQFIQRGARRIG